MVCGPFIYLKLIDAIKYVKKKYPTTKIYITTNGVLLIKQLGKMIIESGLDQMTISINFHSRGKYKENSGKDLYYIVITNTLNFLEILNEDGIKRKPLMYVPSLDKLNDGEEIKKLKNIGINLLVLMQEFRYTICKWEE